MSTVHGGQGNIIKDGLVLWLDAANPKSYPPPYDGTAWSDLSGVNNNATLGNGSSYVTNNFGSISFDGADDIVTIPNIPFGTNPWTINIWFETDNLQSQNDTLIAVSASAATNNWQLSYDNPQTLRFFYKGGLASDAFSLNYTFATGRTHNVCITKKTNNDIIAYSNGQQTASVNYASNYNFTQSIRLGLNRGNVAYYNGRISVVQLYSNKSLSADEVLRNYNATRGRFGI